MDMQGRKITDVRGRPATYEVSQHDGGAWVRNCVTGVEEFIGANPYTARQYLDALHRLAAKEGTR